MTDRHWALEDGVRAWSDAIVAAHGALALPLPEGAPDLPAPLAPGERPTPQALEERLTPQPVDERLSPLGALAKQAGRAGYWAALRLGFVPVDAACVAQAWGLQTARTGQFDPTHWPDEPTDFGLPEPQTEARSSKGSADHHVLAFAPCPQALGLYAVLPDAQWVGRMARAGVPTVQLRFKSTDARAVEREVRAAVAAVQGTGALLFINDHWQAAIDARAYGVHLGQEDLSDAGQPALATIRAAGLRLGLSTHGYAEMQRAQACRPSYTALGAVYATTLKRMATAPQGPARLAAYARLLRGQSLVAIGGIDWARLPQVLASGVGSVAVVRALIAATDPEAEVKRWLRGIATGGL
jgi:thiamine-phosphate pyrophosphorylase